MNRQRLFSRAGAGVALVNRQLKFGWTLPTLSDAHFGVRVIDVSSSTSRNSRSTGWPYG
jgi:hypothetical protein